MAQQPVPDGRHHDTYGDYAAWPDDERWEIIDGVPSAIAPAPNRRHQEVALALGAQLFNPLSGSGCRPYIAPFDIRLPHGNEADDQVDRVVQPDLSVFCSDPQ